jgi:excisionase family DNA binding protein
MEVCVADGPFLTVEEAAKRLRIGRTLAYQLARRYRSTGGAEGLPVVAFGSILRVPRAKLEELAGGPIDEVEPTPIVELDTRRSEPPALPQPVRRSRSSTRSSAQPALPFTATDAS